MAIQFLKAGDTSWIVPSGVSSIKVHAIGCGADGTVGTTNANGWRLGGGAGAYSVTNALSVTPGATVFCSVAAANSAADTWLNKTSNAAPASTADGVLAKRGLQGTNGTAGSNSGGQAASCVGDTIFTGGGGGRQTSTGTGSGGGAGAAGPDGIGRTGGNSSSSGNGGAGGCDGLLSTVGGNIGNAQGGAGGNGPLGTGGGTGAAASGNSGGNATAGTGGGGGASGATGAAAGNGSQYDTWTATAGTYSGQTAGPGGGGGGSNTGTAGNAGGYGAGGGAGRATAGSGTAGILVIEYTPAFAPPPRLDNGFQALLAR